MENTKQKNSKYILFALSIAFLFCFLILNTHFLKSVSTEIINIIYFLKYNLSVEILNKFILIKPLFNHTMLGYIVGNIISYILPYIFKHSFLYFALICYLIYIYKSNLSKKLLCLIPTYIFVVCLIIINITYVTDFMFGNFVIKSLYNLGFVSYRPTVIRSISDFILVYYMQIIMIYNILSTICNFVLPCITLLMIICFVLNVVNLILNLKIRRVFKILLFVILGLFTYRLIDVLVLSESLYTVTEFFVSTFLSYFRPSNSTFFLYQMIYILYEALKMFVVLINASVYMLSVVITFVTFILYIVYVFKNINSKPVKVLSIVLPIIIMCFGILMFSISGSINIYNIVKSILNLFIIF